MHSLQNCSVLLRHAGAKRHTCLVLFVALQSESCMLLIKCASQNSVIVRYAGTHLEATLQMRIQTQFLFFFPLLATLDLFPPPHLFPSP